MTPPITSHFQSRWLPLLMAISIFMQMLDATILNTALPKIAIDLNVSPLNMQSAVISYALTVALLIPASGYLADLFGTKKTFILALVVFMAGSLLCALSTSLPMLVFSRVIQGMGGAILMPVPRLAIMKVYEKKELIKAINYAIMPALIGPILGPLVGGYLVEYASWHWIFLINIPFGMLGIILALPIMPDVYGKVNRFDYIGFFLIAFMATGLTLALEIAPHSGMLLWAFLFMLLSCISAVAYLRHARRYATPIFPTSLFLVRTFRIGLTGNLVSRLGIGAMPFLLPLFYQLAYGLSASVSGWLMVPAVLAALISKPFVSSVIARFGYRRLLRINTRILGLLMIMVAIPPLGTPLWVWVILMLAIGFGNSLQFTAMNTLSIADLRPEQTSGGNSLLSINQQLSTSFGIAIGALLLKVFSIHAINDGNLHTTFRYTFLSVGLITFCSSVIFAHLHSYDGDALLRKKAPHDA
ncbi:MAG: MFS transporter [Cardiobacteriaceae bacterium]|nr:MFS transporter [Cardiobacteriaceae bacterium]